MKRLAAESESPTPSSVRDDLAGALHEVSNTLTVVLGWLDAARRDCLPGSALEAIDVALSHARLGHTIARRAIGAVVDDVAVTRSALSVARDAVRGVEQEAQRAGVRVEVVDDADSDLLLASAPVAQQILINLLLNAVQFSPEGTAVELVVRSGRGPMQFIVRDSGPGIAPDRLESLFQSPESTRRGGAGIGLRHAHALAGSHGGCLGLASTGPKGSEFELVWPVGDAPSRALGTIPPQSLDGVRVVLLEDDPAVQALVELGLTARGAVVAAASTLEELVAILAHGVFDVALVDLSPLGAAPARAVAQIERSCPGLAVVVISGSVAPSVDAPNIVAWVRKPFEIAELVQAITEI